MHLRRPSTITISNPPFLPLERPLMIIPVGLLGLATSSSPPSVPYLAPSHLSPFNIFASKAGTPLNSGPLTILGAWPCPWPLRGPGPSRTLQITHWMCGSSSVLVCVQKQASGLCISLRPGRTQEGLKGRVQEAQGPPLFFPIRDPLLLVGPLPVFP